MILLFASFFQNICSLQAEKATFSQDQALLEKNITLLIADAKLTCEYAYIDKTKRKITLQKEVLFNNSQLIATCNQAELFFEDKTLSLLKLIGNVEIQKNELLLYAGAITIFPQKDQMIVEGSPEVQIFDLRSQSLLQAKELEIYSFLKSGEEKIIAKKGIHGVISKKHLETIQEKLHGATTSKKNL